MKVKQSVSRSTRKGRKRRFTAPSHVRAKLMSAPLSKELQKQHGVRALPVRRGDEVKLVRGTRKFRGKTGKVTACYRLKWKIYVEGFQTEKKNGAPIKWGFYPSNVVITKLHMDKNRERVIAKRTRKSSGKSDKITDVEN